ncbi:MAG: geranylgeranyl reductase, partial [Saprospiraceae bacterium]
TVARQLGGVDLDERNNCVAVRAYYRGITDLKPGENELHFLPKLLPGYLWIFPLADGLANVGIGMLKKAAISKKIKLRTVLDQLPEYAPGLALRLQGAERLGTVQGFALPLYTGQAAISGPRYLLCGDAAALVDPLQGHGIDHAMASGMLAAQYARQCCLNNDFSAARLRAYDAAIRRGIGVELGRNAFLLRIVTRFPVLMRGVGWLGYFEKTVNWLIRKLKL